MARRERVLVTAFPFAERTARARELLQEAGVEYALNPVGRTLQEVELVELARDVDVLIAGTEPITARAMAAAPKLRLIARVGIGLDTVDLLAARARGIAVSYTPDAPAPAVAELTLGLMLALLRHVPAADRAVRAGSWRRLMGRRLSGLTVGVIGVGRVGSRVVRLVRAAFPDVRILANDIAPDAAFGQEQQIQWVDKPELLAGSDIVTLHVPLTAQTYRMMTARELGLMRPNALLINTARGGLIDEHDLAEALRSGRLEGAAVDVFEKEPYSGELATIQNCILTCHMGSMSEDCRARMEIEATEDALRFIRHEPLLRPVPTEEYDAAALRALRVALP